MAGPGNPYETPKTEGQSVDGKSSAGSRAIPILILVVVLLALATMVLLG